MKNILIINPHGIGDVLFTTPLVSNLRRQYPAVRICYIGNRRTAELLGKNTKINRVFTYDRDAFVAVYKKNVIDFVFKWVHFIQEIKKEQFDLVFDFSLHESFGFVSFICGIPRRVGYDYKGRGRYLTDKFFFEGYEGRHVIEYYLDLLKNIGIPVVDTRMELPITQEDRDWAQGWLKQNNIPKNKPLAALIPGGGASWGLQAKNKRWPAQNYGDLIHKMIAQKDVAVILMGDASEGKLCEAVAQQASFPLYSVVGQTSIGQMAALLHHCRFAVVNDGGPLHVAVAVGIRTVSIFGPVDEAVYGPYPRESHYVVKKGLACQPCYRRFRQAACEHISCLSDLSVDEVYKTIERLL